MSIFFFCSLNSMVFLFFELERGQKTTPMNNKKLVQKWLATFSSIVIHTYTIFECTLVSNQIRDPIRVAQRCITGMGSENFCSYFLLRIKSSLTCSFFSGETLKNVPLLVECDFWSIFHTKNAKISVFVCILSENHTKNAKNTNFVCILSEKQG